MKFMNVYIYIYISKDLKMKPSYFSFCYLYKHLFFRDEGLFFDHSSFDQTTPSVVFFPRSGFSFLIKWFLP